MKKNIDLVRYKELLKLEADGNLSLLDDAFYELLDFQSSIQNQISYNRKEIYFLLVEKYLNSLLTPTEFRSKFIELEHQDSRTLDIIKQDFRQLEVFTLPKNLNKFSEFQDEILTLCSEYGEIWDGNIRPMSETEFYSLVKKQYLQLPIFVTNNLIYKNLVSRSFKILILIIGLEFLLIFYYF